MKKRGCLFWLVIVGAGLVLLVGGLVGTLTVVTFNSEASKTAEQFVDGHPDLAAFIGSPMTVDWWRNVHLHYSSNKELAVATIHLTVYGSIGKTTVRVLLIRPKADAPWEPVYGAVVDSGGRSTLALDADRFPAHSMMATEIRENVKSLPGIGAVDIGIEGDDVRLVRWSK